jgi:DnaJ-class molecular chaperone
MPATREKDLYALLGVKETATADEVKKAYRELAKKVHPDRTGGDKAKEQRFKEISAAYEVLSDPARRQQYDAMRRGGFRAGSGGMPDFSAFQGIDGIEELFGSIFGFGGGRGGKGGRVVYETRPFTGFGNPGGFGGFSDASPPRPVVDKVVRTAGGHELLRKGDDVHGEVEIAIDEAVLGAKVSVPTLEGNATITIPAGTSSGRKLRLRGKGVSGRGDHYVTVKIVVPEHIDERAEELIREFAKRAPVRPRR